MSRNVLDDERVVPQTIDGPSLTPYLPDVAEASPPASGSAPSATSRFSRNSAMSVGRLFLSTAVALLLPGYLTHKLPVATYSAWVLILQLSAYVGYLDFGVQTAISKYVAEYDARQDPAGANMRASAGLAIMLGAGLLGVVLSVVLAWKVPQLFHEMPAVLYHDARVAVLFLGVSLSFGLVCSVTSAIFLGLQRYGVPTLITLGNRLLFTIAVMAAVWMHSSLAVMGAAVAAVNILTGLTQFIAWKRLASHVRLSLRGLDFAVVRQMLAYCSVIAVWLVGMLCVSGLDVTIVGRYDYAQTAFYSIATLPTNFLIAIMGAALGPLMPETSARSAANNSVAMGQMLLRVTRYSMLLLVLSGVPLLVGGFYALRLWVGQDYALHATGYLRILILANIIRNICLPYATMLVATERQRTALAGAIAEAIVNLSVSIYLARTMGAAGVAIGTLLGAIVSIAMHFGVSMYYTRNTFRISRLRLFLSSVLRPAVVLVPSLLSIALWWRPSAPAIGPVTWAATIAATLLLSWYVGLDPEERLRLLGLIKSKAGVLGRSTVSR